MPHSNDYVSPWVARGNPSQTVRGLKTWKHVLVLEGLREEMHPFQRVVKYRQERNEVEREKLQKEIPSCEQGGTALE